MVKIRVGQDTFPIQKTLLCARSEYFNAAFNGSFKEASDKEMDVDTKPEVFACFVNRVFTGVFEIEKPENNDESLLKAIEVYVFADKYESTKFRRTVFDKIANFIIAKSISFENCALLLESLPEVSSLRKFVLNVLHQGWQIEKKENFIAAFDFLPKDVVADIMFARVSRRCAKCKALSKTSQRVDLCKYHEHKDEKENEACKSTTTSDDSHSEYE
jgi:hypothetical protein